MLPFIIPLQSIAATLVNYLFYYARDSLSLCSPAPEHVCMLPSEMQHRICTYTRVFVYISTYTHKLGIILG